MTTRRSLLQTSAAALALSSTRLPAAEPEPGPAMRRALPATHTPGKPGDFDFLTGHWHIANWQRKPDGSVDRFEGSARVVGILAGIASVEELNIPSRDFAGLGLRLLDVKKQQWSDFWVNAKSGELSTPGLLGSFEDGAGIFESQDGGVLYRSVWDQITPKSCRWQQATSRDGGKTWQLDWSMQWQRTA